VLPPFLVHSADRTNEEGFAEAAVAYRARLHNFFTDAPLVYRAQNGGDYEIPSLHLKDGLEGEGVTPPTTCTSSVNRLRGLGQFRTARARKINMLVKKVFTTNGSAPGQIDEASIKMRPAVSFSRTLPTHRCWRILSRGNASGNWVGLHYKGLGICGNH